MLFDTAIELLKIVLSLSYFFAVTFNFYLMINCLIICIFVAYNWHTFGDFECIWRIEIFCIHQNIMTFSHPTSIFTSLLKFLLIEYPFLHHCEGYFSPMYSSYISMKGTQKAFYEKDYKKCKWQMLQKCFEEPYKPMRLHYAHIQIPSLHFFPIHFKYITLLDHANSVTIVSYFKSRGENYSRQGLGSAWTLVYD